VRALLVREVKVDMAYSFLWLGILNRDSWFLVRRRTL